MPAKKNTDVILVQKILTNTSNVTSCIVMLKDVIKVSLEPESHPCSSWPALSPDLSPIEHLWDELGRRVRHRQNPPETLQELRDALVHEWNNIHKCSIGERYGDIMPAKEEHGCDSLVYKVLTKTRAM
jgi:hypothetical protein